MESMTAVISIQEEDTLRRILRHHNVPMRRELVDHLAELMAWVRADEHAKVIIDPNNRALHKPPYLVSFLSTLGIYGAEVCDPTPKDEPPAGDTDG